jgi:glutathione synthase/RimK-type ligase-like ATP-grasp enzyme
MEISKDTADFLLPDQDDGPIIISCGRNKAKARIVIINEEGKYARLSDDLCSSLCLPRDFPVTLHIKKKGNEWALGPVICLLTEIDKERESIFGSVQTFCEQLAMEFQKHHVLFYVSSIDDFGSETPAGYYYSSNDWHKQSTPLPDIVHNRIHIRKNEQSKNFQMIKERLKAENIPIFNDHYLDKWMTHQLLYTYPHLHPYLPETVLFQDKDQLLYWLRANNELFLKPVHGSQGKRIFKLSSHSNTVKVNFSSSKSGKTLDFLSFNSMYHEIRPLLRKEPYLIQQAIPILLYYEKPVDFRLLCYRSSRGKWQVSSAVARITGEHSFVTNLAQGGKVFPVFQVLEDVFNRREAYHLRKFMYEAAVDVSDCLSALLDGVFAEFAIDMALDVNGRPWVLEVNTKPSKRDLNPAAGVPPSVQSIVRICIDYSGFMT